jgi:hypothetical protein
VHGGAPWTHRSLSVRGPVYSRPVAEMGTNSLQFIAEEVRQERLIQLRHFDALDLKAGIVLGFAGALVALGPIANVLADIGRLVAVVSGLIAIVAFWPRRYWATNLATLRDVYLGSEPVFTRLRLLDTHIAMSRELVTTLQRKALLLKLAMVGLLVAASFTATALALD